MSSTGIRQTVIDALGRVAPEIDPATIEPEVPLREQFDIDSVDLLNFLASLEETFAITIPERDYDRIVTLADLVAYVASRTSAGPP